MIRSMTGYGRGEVRSGGGGFSIEVRSVNSRFIDIQMRTPRAVAALEPRLRKAVQDRFSRGRFDLLITRNGENGRAVRLALDAVRAEQYVLAFREMKDRFSLAGEVDLALLAGIDGIFVAEDVQDDLESIWAELSVGITGAFDALDRMRIDEGRALVQDMSSRLDRIDGLVGEIGLRAPRSVEEAHQRLTDNVRRLMNEAGEGALGPDPARMTQEIALLAERTDISEEMTRLASHVRQFRSLLSDAQTEPVGRKLDFLLQEMNREVNTIGSKAQDAAISHRAVEVKAELEKIKEQVQNVE